MYVKSAFMCMDGCFACIYDCALPEEGVRSHGTRVPKGCELLFMYGCWKSSTRPLEEQPVSSVKDEPSLQPQTQVLLELQNVLGQRVGWSVQNR